VFGGGLRNLRGLRWRLRDEAICVPPRPSGRGDTARQIALHLPQPSLGIWAPELGEHRPAKRVVLLPARKRIGAAPRVRAMRRRV